MDKPDTERPLGPSQEGSEQAQLVLRRMCDWKTPIGSGELAAITGLSPETVTLTMRGLKARGRVVAEGHGAGARWVLAHMVKAAGQ